MTRTGSILGSDVQRQGGHLRNSFGWGWAAITLLAAACGSTGGTNPPGARDGGTAIADRDAGEGPSLDAGSDAGPRPDGGGLGTWTSGPPLPLGVRQETAVVALDGEVVVIAGYGSSGFGTRVEAYDPSAGTWRALPDVPAAMHHPNAVVHDGRIYVLGFLVAGFQEDGRVFVYDPAADRWTDGTPMPANRARGSSVVAQIGGLLYVAGGLKNAVSTADFDVYDPAAGTWSPLPPLPRAMDHGAGGAHENKLYVAGGRAGGIEAIDPALDVYDVAEGRWTSGPAMPTGRAGTAGAFLDGRLYVFGGEGNAQNPPTYLFDDVEVFDVASATWHVLTPMDPAKHGTGAAAIEGRIYVPGGATVQAFGAVDTLSVFVP